MNNTMTGVTTIETMRILQAVAAGSRQWRLSRWDLLSLTGAGYVQYNDPRDEVPAMRNGALASSMHLTRKGRAHLTELELATMGGEE